MTLGVGLMLVTCSWTRKLISRWALLVAPLMTRQTDDDYSPCRCEGCVHITPSSCALERIFVPLSAPDRVVANSPRETPVSRLVAVCSAVSLSTESPGTSASMKTSPVFRRVPVNDPSVTVRLAKPNLTRTFEI